MLPWADMLEESQQGKQCKNGRRPVKSVEAELCPIDLYENDDGLLIRADLPGFTKEQVSISLDGEGRLQIKATRDSSKVTVDNGEWRSVLKERSEAGEIGRTVMLPRDAQPDKAQASLQEGVLEVRIPKEQPQKRQILIN